MKTELFAYSLPENLIAQNPAEKREASRLLLLDKRTGQIKDEQFRNIAHYLRPGDTLVLNNTKVLPARFFCRRKTGANLEGLFIEANPDGTWRVMLKNARRVKTGEVIFLEKRTGGCFEAELLDKDEQGIGLMKPLSGLDTEQILEQIGYAPLPPYIRRDRQVIETTAESDLRRYQTVYAETPGAVAAPTAGLHFTEKLLEKVRHAGVNTAFVTLHVGLGTFRPVETDTLDEHKMHSEQYQIDGKNAEIINRTHRLGGRIIAVGTTAVRSLESAADDTGKIFPRRESTELFIKPGYGFRAVDAMITNFHLPRSTLLALVSAMAGLENILNAYRYAVEKKYRFYSYGDAMFIY